jgi:hypothetical protein
MTSHKRKGRYDSERDDILFRFSYLPAGGTEAGQICPACKGGASQEGSLSITRRGGLLLYNCHRATCPFHGAVTIAGAAGAGDSSEGAERKARGNYVRTYEINEATLKFLAIKYGISSENFRAAGLRWSGDGDGPLTRRVCFPIYGPDSKQRGTSYRSYEDGVVPKAIIQLHTEDAVCQSWYKWRKFSDTLVIVEDPVSAIKLAPHVHSLSLMGVHISDEKMDEIKAQKYQQIILSLDNDATREAIKLQLKYRNRVDNFFVHGLEKDIKDMNEEELNAYLSDI